MKGPFSEAKLKALLEGLEVSILNLNELENGLRIDAELYKKDFVYFEKRIKGITSTKLGDEVKLIKKGIFDIKSDCYADSGIPFVRISNLKNMIIDTNEIIYIPESENDKNLNTFLKRNDIILSKTANAAASIVNIPFCNTSQDTVAIKLKDKSLVNSHFIVVYLNSKYGLAQMQRWFTGNIQMHLNLEDCKNNLLIPVYSSEFQKRIKDLFEQSINLTELSKTKYSEAEDLLFKAVEMKGFTPTKKSINIKRFKESFLQTGRLDAEYYQPKFEEVIDHLRKSKHDSLFNLVEISKSIEPGSIYYAEEGLPFIRVADYNRYGLGIPDKKLSYAFCKENKALIEMLKPKKGTILFSKDGSVGTAYLLSEDIDGITSGAILHLQVKDTKKVVPEYLTLALNSKLVQMQAERDAGGSIILHWRTNEIENVIIPVIDHDKQIEIAKLVQESFDLKNRSVNIQATCKRAVEIAIEESELKSINFINSQLGK